MKKGMNPDAVERMGADITQAGEDAMTEFKEILGRVEDLDWTGEDRDSFVEDFNDGLQALAETVRGRCEEFGERASRNATKQREASA